MLPNLLQDPRYNGNYVAIVNGKLVDSDPDKTILVKRAYEKFGYRPISTFDSVSKEKEYAEFSSPE